MVIQALVFYLFAAITVASAFMVIASRNPVHSVLFLILAFFTSAGILVLMGAEFIAMLLVVVYVGAVAVLFLFVVMMLDINFAELRQGFLQYMPVGALIGVILLMELILVLGSINIEPELVAKAGTAPTPDNLHNTAALGQLIYTDYFLLFQASGMILLIAMIGAIVLTHRKREGVRRQVINDQVARTREDAVAMHDVKPGQGI